MTFVELAVALLFVGAAFYLLLVFPIAVVVSCLTSTTLSRSERVWWVIATTIAAPIGTWAYCFFTPQDPRTRMTAWMSMAAGFAFAIAAWMYI